MMVNRMYRITRKQFFEPCEAFVYSVQVSRQVRRNAPSTIGSLFETTRVERVGDRPALFNSYVRARCCPRNCIRWVAPHMLLGPEALFSASAEVAPRPDRRYCSIRRPCIDSNYLREFSDGSHIKPFPRS